MIETDERPAGPRTARGGFYWRAALIVAALIVLSFSQTYFLPMATSATPVRLLRHLHGLAFFAFTALFVWQAWLVRRRRIAQHREWGTLGAALAGMMLVLGLWMAGAAIDERIARQVDRPFEGALYNCVDIALFCGLIGWSIREAWHRLDWHRRLAFAAMLGLLGPAWSRVVLKLPPLYPWQDMAPGILADLGLMALALHDRHRDGRVHPATWTAAAIMLPLHLLEPLVARSGWWVAVAPKLFALG
jgi:hypothetical protein